MVYQTQLSFVLRRNISFTVLLAVKVILQKVWRSSLYLISSSIQYIKGTSISLRGCPRKSVRCLNISSTLTIYPVRMYYQIFLVLLCWKWAAWFLFLLILLKLNSFLKIWFGNQTMIQNVPKNYFVCYTNAHLWDRSGSVLENCQGVGAKLEERKVSLSNHTERVKLFTSVKKQKSHAESSSRAVTFISASGYSGLKNWIHLALYYRDVKSRVTIFKILIVKLVQKWKNMYF